MPNPNSFESRSGQPSDNQQPEGTRNEQQKTGPAESNAASGSTTPSHESERPDNVRPLRSGGARGTAAMDPGTRQEVARKGGLAVSRNKQHMADIGRKGGQSVSKNREHMAEIGRKGGAASRGSRGSEGGGSESGGGDQTP